MSTFSHMRRLLRPGRVIAFLGLIWVGLLWAGPTEALASCRRIQRAIAAGDLGAAEARVRQATRPEIKQCAVYLVEAYVDRQEATTAKQWLNRAQRFAHPILSRPIYGAVQYYRLLLDPPEAESDFNKAWHHLRVYAPERAQALEKEVRQRFQAQLLACQSDPWGSEACTFPARWAKPLGLDTRSMETIRTQVQAYHTLREQPLTAPRVNKLLAILKRLEQERVDIGDEADRLRSLETYLEQGAGAG